MTHTQKNDAVSQRLLQLEQRSRRLARAVGATAILLLITICVAVQQWRGYTADAEAARIQREAERKEWEERVRQESRDAVNGVRSSLAVLEKRVDRLNPPTFTLPETDLVDFRLLVLGDVKRLAPEGLIPALRDAKMDLAVEVRNTSNRRVKILVPARKDGWEFRKDGNDIGLAYIRLHPPIFGGQEHHPVKFDKEESAPSVITIDPGERYTIPVTRPAFCKGNGWYEGCVWDYGDSRVEIEYRIGLHPAPADAPVLKDGFGLVEWRDSKAGLLRALQ
jgi:hypothetical protein